MVIYFVFKMFCLILTLVILFCGSMKGCHGLCQLMCNDLSEEVGQNCIFGIIDGEEDDQRQWCYLLNNYLQVEINDLHMPLNLSKDPQIKKITYKAEQIMSIKEICKTIIGSKAKKDLEIWVMGKKYFCNTNLNNPELQTSPAAMVNNMVNNKELQTSPTVVVNSPDDKTTTTTASSRVKSQNESTAATASSSAFMKTTLDNKSTTTTASSRVNSQNESTAATVSSSALVKITLDNKSTTTTASSRVNSQNESTAATASSSASVKITLDNKSTTTTASSRVNSRTVTGTASSSASAKITLDNKYELSEQTIIYIAVGSSGGGVIVVSLPALIILIIKKMRAAARDHLNLTEAGIPLQEISGLSVESAEASGQPADSTGLTIVSLESLVEGSPASGQDGHHDSSDPAVLVLDEPASPVASRTRSKTA